MAIYRGTGGAGDANNNVTVNEVAQYASSASNSATEAEQSAINAASSEATVAADAASASASATDSANSATASANSATASANSATASATSASAASTSETNAANSATASAGSATASANSATSASTSATTATTQAGIATTKASEASTSASNAATSESNAAGSATSASNSATASANSATSAATSATNAGTSESNASTSEANAASSASSAATSATTATTQAGIATTKASEASVSASNAATSETNAATSASSAASSATTATTKASEASSSATEAATSATNSANSATASASSATAAASSATSAAASAASAATLLDNFDDRYLGPKATDPTVDNDGDPLTSGALYFNTTVNEMRAYDGSLWVAASSASIETMDKFRYTATVGQTVFTGVDDGSVVLALNVGAEIVTLNGVVLEQGTDYTATGSSITLTTAAAADDELNIYAFGNFTVADVVSASTGGTFQNNIAVNGTVTATSFSGDGSGLTGIDSLPSQTGNSGKYLTTDGTDPSWAELDTDANSTTKGLYEHAHTISSNYSITAGNNAMSAGPITIANGVSVTIPDGSTWTIV